MDEPDRTGIVAYVRAAAALHGMPLSAEREALVVDVMERLRLFAADLNAFPLDDRDEPAGIFQP